LTKLHIARRFVIDCSKTRDAPCANPLNAQHRSRRGSERGRGEMLWDKHKHRLAPVCGCAPGKRKIPCLDTRLPHRAAAIASRQGICASNPGNFFREECSGSLNEDYIVPLAVVPFWSALCGAITSTNSLPLTSFTSFFLCDTSTPESALAMSLRRSTPFRASI
jgi:hypothetical protein